MPIRLRLISWNVHGTSVAPRVVPRMRAVAGELEQRSPDLALLQEVWTPVQANLIASRLGDYARVDTPEASIGRTGGLLCFVSRRSGWRVAGHSFEEFERAAPSWKIWEGDGLARKGILRVDLLRSDERLVVMNTHLQAAYGTGGYSEIRRAQLAQLRRALSEVGPGVPVLVGGDLNTPPGEEIFAELDGIVVDLTADLRERCGCGTSVGSGQWIDYVLARADAAWRASARVERIVSTRRDWPYSDHQGLDARVELHKKRRPLAGRAARRALRGPSTRRAWLGAALRLGARGLLGLGALALAAWVGSSPARAADDVLPGDTTDELQSSRRARSMLETPLSLSVVDREEMLRAKPAVTLMDALEDVPGVFVQAAPNFSQDARISIRGYGARAPFGVRGIRVYVDGIPTTLADGQSEVDSIDLAFMERAEVLRGPVSSLFGGGGGGVLSFHTLDPTLEPQLRARAVLGSHHLSRYESVATGHVGPIGYTAGAAYTRLTGYRDHARGQQHTGLLKLVREWEDGTRVAGHFSGVWAPEADDPGGLDRAAVNADREQARPANVQFDAGERLDQQRWALDVLRPLGEHQRVRARGYWLERDFKNRLPFTDSGRVVFDRDAWGASLVWEGERGRVNALAGVDLDVQEDRRKRYDNLNGVQGPEDLYQYETVRALGGFAELDVSLGRSFGVVAGARYDWMEYIADDRFTANGDQSDRFHLREMSPRVGLYLDRSPGLFAYTNLLTAFRPPTTTELGQDDLGGFQTDLEPELSRGVEAGVKGRLGERLFYDVAAFYLRVRDAIVPFQNSDGRDLARNAAKVVRLGAEVGLGARLRPGLEVRGAYTYADYEYRDYDLVDAFPVITVTEFDGNTEPGTPRHNLSAELRWEHPTGWFAVLGVRHFSDIEVRDDNTLESDDATVSDLRVGRDSWYGDTLVRPFFAITNWSGAEYDGQLRMNAFGGRAFEPAPETELSVGLEVRWGARSQ